MKVNIQSIGFKISEKLKSYIDKKIQKLIRINEHSVGIDAILKVEKAGTIENKIVEIKFKVPGNDLFARKNADTFEEAVNLSIEALKRQQKKQIGKLRRK